MFLWIDFESDELNALLEDGEPVDVLEAWLMTWDPDRAALARYMGFDADGRFTHSGEPVEVVELGVQPLNGEQLVDDDLIPPACLMLNGVTLGTLEIWSVPPHCWPVPEGVPNRPRRGQPLGLEVNRLPENPPERIRFVVRFDYVGE